MAPELLERVPYDGSAVDIWSAAVLLFLLRTGTVPFLKATK